MNAVIYIAGRGMRLGPHSQERPKVLLEFGGRSLLERHVMFLARLGVGKLYAVTGHRRELLQAAFGALQSRYGLEIEEMFNADFTEGSVLSMHTSLPALEAAKGGVLLMDGDVLYDIRMLRRLMEADFSSALLVDRAFSKADDDPVLAPMRNGKPFDFVKRWRGEADAVGESVGFFKVGPADLPLLIAETRARVEGGRRGDSYDDVLRVLAQRGRFDAVDITGMPWTEIDFPGDIERARNVILPALRDEA